MKLILLLTISGAALAERPAAGPVTARRPGAPAMVVPAGAPTSRRGGARNGVALHRVRRGETLAAIARAYEVPADLLAGLNRIRSPEHLRSGRLLVVPLSPAARRAAEVIARRNAGAGRKVRVRPGDSLWSIARRHGVAVKALARWNGISDPGRHRLRVGRLLALKGRRRSPAARGSEASPRRARHRASAAAKPRRVRVRPGDSLWSLAQRFGVSVRDLARWNGIRRSREDELRAGRLLVVRRSGAR